VITSLNCLALVDLPLLSHVVGERVVRIWSAKQSLDGQQNRANLQRGTPLLCGKHKHNTRSLAPYVRVRQRLVQQHSCFTDLTLRCYTSITFINRINCSLSQPSLLNLLCFPSILQTYFKENFSNL